jgi:hypothetical protein
VGTGSGDPEVPKLKRAWGYNWATLSPEDINTEVWSSREVLAASIIRAIILIVHNGGSKHSLLHESYALLERFC